MDRIVDTFECVIEEFLFAPRDSNVSFYPRGRVFGQLFELALQIEREQFLKAGHYEHTLESLQARGMCGVQFVVFDDHAGLKAARRAVLGAATWQRCQFHLDMLVASYREKHPDFADWLEANEPMADARLK